MDRSTFLQQGCLACLAVLTAPALLTGCAPMAYVTGNMAGNDLVVPLSVFDIPSSPGSHRSYVVVQHGTLRYPIALYRSADGVPRALLMRCTHQGSQLRLTENQLYCTSHGSEFNTSGEVTQGPAADPLRSFSVTVEGQEIHISLKSA